MNPLDFQKLASYLVTKNGAAEFRTAISRSYYGVFLLCCKKINELGFNLPQDASAHDHVRRYLNNCGDFQLEKISSQLLDMRSERNRADYVMGDTKVEYKNNANKSVILAINPAIK